LTHALKARNTGTGQKCGWKETQLSLSVDIAVNADVLTMLLCEITFLFNLRRGIKAFDKRSRGV
jgi:hypothetical protein